MFFYDIERFVCFHRRRHFAYEDMQRLDRCENVHFATRLLEANSSHVSIGGGTLAKYFFEILKIFQKGPIFGKKNLEIYIDFWIIFFIFFSFFRFLGE